MEETISEKIRRTFGEADDKRDAGITAPENVVRYDNIQYGGDARWQVLDVYRPKNEEGKILPVIISVHGGGWVYGDKDRYQWYCLDLATRGFAVVNFTYRLAPEFQYPAPFEDTNLAVEWTLAHAAEYGFDTKNIFMVGDSAGAHILSLYGAICTNPEYAKTYPFTVPQGFVPNAIVLNCGLAEIVIKKDQPGDTPKLMEVFLPGKGTPEELHQISMKHFVTGDYPPTYIMTAEGDFLCDQAPVMAAKLTEQNVPMIYRFYQSKERVLGHVFQLNIRLDEAKECNDDECNFFRRYMK